MQSCDVLIVGAGPAGSSCAWKLARAGLDVLILDRERFPRDKVCGGWITPVVMEELQIDASRYARGRVLQAITGFRVSRLGDCQSEAHYDRPISYGIRRFEFDHFLVQRSGARLLQETALTDLRRAGDGWIVNGQIRTPLVIGAGGHFCPVARLLGRAPAREAVVAAQEIEFAMDSAQQPECSVDPEVPELYFCGDMKGYGWTFRKGNYLNVGLGRLGNRNLAQHVAAFAAFLKEKGRIPQSVPSTLHGHAYLLYGYALREPVHDGALLIGDAAGLAYAQSGEGIRPAVESGLLAADVILGTCARYGRKNLEAYRRLLAARFGEAKRDWTFGIAGLLPQAWIGWIAGRLLATDWFSRRVVIDRWFLHSHQRALPDSNF